MIDRVTVERLLGDAARADLIEAATSLIKVPSVSGDEAGVISVAQAWLESRGVPVQVIARDPKRPNLIATIGNGSPLLALNGHLDTVPVSDRSAWRTDPHVAT